MFEALTRKIDLGYYFQTYYIQDTNTDSSIAPDVTHIPRGSVVKGMSIENKHPFSNGSGTSKINSKKLDQINSVSFEFNE